MAKEIIDPAPAAYRLLNPGSVVLVTVGDGTRDNVFAVTWNMPVRKDPGMAAILVGKRHFSYSLISITGEFGINVPHGNMADTVLACGTISGYDENDKFDRFGLVREPANKIKAPLLREAVAHLECRVSQVVDMGASALLLGQILEAKADPDHFRDGEWKFDKGLELLHHLGGDRFCVSTRAVTAKPPLLLY